MIWYSKKIILIHPPRTGGSSFETLLRQNSLGSSIVKRAIFKLVEPLKFEGPFRQATKHLTASQIKALVGEDYYREATKIGFLRNPYDRIISHYHFGAYREINALSGKTLSEFLDKYEPKPFEYGTTLDDYYDDHVDLFIRFENYQEDVQKVCRKLSIDDPIVHETRSNRTKEWKPFYEENTFSRVNDLFKNDFYRFNYTMISND